MRYKLASSEMFNSWAVIQLLKEQASKSLLDRQRSFFVVASSWPTLPSLFIYDLLDGRVAPIITEKDQSVDIEFDWDGPMLSNSLDYQGKFYGVFCETLNRFITTKEMLRSEAEAYVDQFESENRGKKFKDHRHVYDAEDLELEIVPWSDRCLD